MGFAHLAMAVRDPNRTARFLQATMGWKPIGRPGNVERPVSWVEIAPGQEIHLIQVADFTPSPFETEFGRHLAVEHPLADFDALKARLVGEGAEIIPALRPTPFQRFFFRSPDGYVFEVVAAERTAEVVVPEGSASHG